MKLMHTVDSATLAVWQKVMTRDPNVQYSVEEWEEYYTNLTLWLQEFRMENLSIQWAAERDPSRVIDDTTTSVGGSKAVWVYTGND